MSFSADPIFKSVTGVPSYPLLDGHYYLVDATYALNEYYRTPFHVRMHLLGEGAELTEYDMADVELTELVPCINDIRSCEDELSKHVEHLLDEGVEIVISDMENCGVPVQDGQLIPNTQEQIQHAQATYELGHRLRELFMSHGLYDKYGELVAEYTGLLENGLIALRRR
jgi:hypothetical protein